MEQSLSKAAAMLSGGDFLGAFAEVERRKTLCRGRVFKE